ncbi:TRAF-type zinc finger domain-containing protein 1 [Iris pallida]|uniref:TRAF-type zinc finger domain-containing protein 1 n=1 Tax=Iris pallida TaxID=29817 RepID=A0AAX6FD55_IRIPA|nr:TRAF-type zinc finger domain-containing protein 1 [Iris pallida]KAJ6821321.1 TRAF-type zinc finger domain-containing protein 1 [Iris pallida]
MEIASELNTKLCSHCEKDIPTSNIDLHYAHCSRNLKKCALCGEMVPKKHEDEHYNETHAPVECSLCSDTVERELWALHKGENCPQRIITCEYCEFPLPAVDLFKHQEICGNRTELCQTCNKYVRLREMINHEIQFHGDSDGTAESSRNVRPEREERARGRPARAGDSTQRKILLTIAVTGIAVLVGSVFLQRKVDSNQ